MTHSRQSTIIAWLFLLVLPSSSSGQVGGVFPFDSASYEEYDYTIFDPHTGSGAPYGGFSRATKSRLAKLPLFGPGLSDHDETDRPKGDFYMQVTDSQGQPYVCRLYHEEELLPESLNESMFLPPKLNKHPLSPSTTASRRSNEHDTPMSAISDTRRQLPQYEGQTDSTVQTNAEDDKSMLLSKEEMNRFVHDDKIVAVQLLLSELEGICGQRHSGDWWSYEWCYEGNMSQFHVRLNNNKNKKRTAAKVSVEDVSSLGKFHSRTTFVDHVEETEPRNKMVGDRRELARVVDEYKDGEVCSETGERRKSYVHFMCCSKKFLDKGKGMLHRNGEKLESTIAALTSIVEDPTCTYNVTVCTSLLCLEEDSRLEASVGLFNVDKKTTFQTTSMPDAQMGQSLAAPGTGRPGSRPPKFPIGSVRDILDKALGHKCLTSDTGAWWTYEFCHTRRIRQFHEEIVSEKTSTGGVLMTRRVDTEHILGQYNPKLGEVYPEEDWKLVHNVTDAPTAAQSVSFFGKGNGAYFEMEYPGGHVCDHTDVTDAAIIAGSAGAGGVERSSSVRYSCGHVPSISVREDATCHYVVHVQVPELCTHPLFMAPVAKRQVVKCLAVSL